MEVFWTNIKSNFNNKMLCLETTQSLFQRAMPFNGLAPHFANSNGFPLLKTLYLLLWSGLRHRHSSFLLVDSWSNGLASLTIRLTPRLAPPGSPPEWQLQKKLEISTGPVTELDAGTWTSLPQILVNCQTLKGVRKDLYRILTVQDVNKN